ncbi:related to dimethylaniline monooxygenase [Cephalotrichum gorgonifer]|uniref:Related to dimethylaniline monooxygenase n=1 Tax=Cephalotrichum gorgonifer TaxID=2041049 RepID=A0AAE8SY13_9PEZI|nr:related to dimethylaniline monooxygenase [Cephalotrichum gorgonifer]
MTMDTYDVVVVGAGWFGLSAAKTRLELHPSEKLIVLESAGSFGGSWSQDRLYPGLKSNNFWGSYEHPDFPMIEEVYGVKHGEHIPAAVLHRYLTDFAKHFGVYERTQLNTQVQHAKQDEDGVWELITVVSGVETAIHTRKLIVATGLTSQPNLPTYPGEETFTGVKFHAKSFWEHGDTTKTAKNVVIVGCGKSAYDCAYSYATADGTQVDLLVRPSGQGPVWLCPGYVTPFRRMLEEMLHTRALTWFSPAPWGAEDGYGVAREWLHKTGIGRFITANWWNTMSNETIDTHGFDTHPELFKLKPWQPAFWTGSGVGIHNFGSSLYDLVREGKIRVHIAEITKLDGGDVHLSNGAVLQADVICCATGWSKESTITYEGVELDGLGLPISADEKIRLREEADREVLDRFPILINQPVLRYERTKAEPLRYYRFIVPPSQFSKRNLAFAGMVSTVSTASFANSQALWISAYFDGKLKREPKGDDEIIKEVMLHTQFGKWRYPCGYGDSLPDFSFDALPYVDLLLNDLGLKIHRKATQIAEIVEPYKPRDYRGLTLEWLSMNGGKQGVGLDGE